MVSASEDIDSDLNAVDSLEIDDSNTDALNLETNLETSSNLVSELDANLESSSNLVSELDTNLLENDILKKESSSKKKATITRTVTKIICNNITTTSVMAGDGRIGEYFNFQLLDSDGKALAGKPISVGFNGHVYEYTTDENGSAKTQINLAKPGGYTFAVCYLGDDNYNSSFEVAKITVIKKKMTLTVPAKTYKASAKTKTLTATIKSNVGNLVSGKKITFTVNKKTYTAKTDANGVASVKISLSTKKTYSFTVKYAGGTYWDSVTATGKLVIK